MVIAITKLAGKKYKRIGEKKWGREQMTVRNSKGISKVNKVVWQISRGGVGGDTMKLGRRGVVGENLEEPAIKGVSREGRPGMRGRGSVGCRLNGVDGIEVIGIDER